MQKIVPFLWFDHQAEEAAQLYTSLFDNSAIGEVTRYAEGAPGPTGKVMTVAFRLAGQDFIALNGGPEFTFTPATSFFVSCDTEEELNTRWEALTQGGAILMPLDEYPFSKRFGWVSDRFGVSWQLNLGHRDQKIAPFLMFVGAQHGNAEAAINFYMSLFDNSRIVNIERHGAGGQDPEGTVMHAIFTLAGQEFMAMDSAYEHAFTFTSAISFFVNCETQAEVDRLWNSLTEGGEEQPCGWLNDRFGVSWQIVPTALGEMLRDPDPEKVKRVTQAFLQMKKLDIKALQEAYAGG